MSLVHIYAPSPTMKAIVRCYCPDCKKQSWFTRICFEWFGPDETCLRCGREWKDKEWMALPFMRGARKYNIKSAKSRYRRVEQGKEQGT